MPIDGTGLMTVGERVPSIKGGSRRFQCRKMTRCTESVVTWNAMRCGKTWLPPPKIGRGRVCSRFVEIATSFRYNHGQFRDPRIGARLSIPQKRKESSQI